jgi:cysteinyl-tRNA synthetase
MGAAPFARWWLHNGHVQIGGEKMSKSLKNYVLIDQALEDYPPQAVRLFILSAHYRSPIAYGPDALDEAQATWTRFESFLRVAPRDEIPEVDADARLESFGAAMDDDLSTPQALAALHELVSAGHKALEAGDARQAAQARAAVVRGLELLGCSTAVDASSSAAVDPLVAYLLELREEARKAKDFAQADAIRDRLSAAGIRVEDSSEGARWFMA